MNRVDAWRMIQRRAAELGDKVKIGCDTFQATGITAYWEAGVTLENAQSMAAHDAAITLILEQEPDWQRTPPGNAGFDLFKSDASGEPSEWCEVKAMTGSMEDRPVGMSRTQFQFAQDKGTSTWLYIVERAGTGQATIVRIQDPAGQARTFTFDQGWRAVAVPVGATI